VTEKLASTVLNRDFVAAVTSKVFALLTSTFSLRIMDATIGQLGAIPTDDQDVIKKCDCCQDIFLQHA